MSVCPLVTGIFAALVAILVLSMIVIAIVKITNYINGKGFKKLLGFELAAVTLWVGVVYLAFTLFGLNTRHISPD